jgi:hypothetical protein
LLKIIIAQCGALDGNVVNPPILFLCQKNELAKQLLLAKLEDYETKRLDVVPDFAGVIKSVRSSNMTK